MPSNARNTVETLADGSVLVRDLPIISEERTEDARYRRERPWRGRVFGSEKPRDRVWLERCRSRLLARAAKGYKLLTTFRHSDEQPEAAGTYTPTEIRLHEVNPGEAPRWTLFADAKFPSRAAYETWKREYPYRSPEISPDYPDELDSVAFLSSEAPYNKYETPNLVETRFRSRKASVAQTWRGDKFAAARSPYAIANAMAGKGEIPRARVGEVGDAIKAKNQAVVGNALTSRGLGGGSTKKEAGVADEEKKPDAEPSKQAAADGSPGGSADPMQALHEKFSSYMAASEARHKELMECMRSMMAAKHEEPDGDEGADEPTQAPDAEPAVFAAAKDEIARHFKVMRAENEKYRAKTEGELLGLRKVIAESQAKEQRSELVVSAESRLASMGFALDDEDKKAIREAAKRGKDSVDDLLAGYKRAHAHAAPSGSFEPVGNALAGEEPQGDEPEALKSLLKQGGEVAAAGKAMFSAWKGLSPRQKLEGWGGDFESFLYDYDERGNKRIALPVAKNGRG